MPFPEPPKSSRLQPTNGVLPSFTSQYLGALHSLQEVTRRKAPSSTRRSVSSKPHHLDSFPSPLALLVQAASLALPALVTVSRASPIVREMQTMVYATSALVCFPIVACPAYPPVPSFVCRYSVPIFFLCLVYPCLITLSAFVVRATWKRIQWAD